MASLSHSGGILCSVGRDGHSKTLVALWDLRSLDKDDGGVRCLARAFTDLSIDKIKIADFDDTRLVCRLGGKIAKLLVEGMSLYSLLNLSRSRIYVHHRWMKCLL